jgi:N12 class adenine-specific DNA methylase
MADLIGAVRLPQGAMNAAAGTDVVVDILFLQKREAGAAPGGPTWDGLAEAVPATGNDAALAINRYFVEHPEMVLGNHARTSSAYGPTYTCRPVLMAAGALADLLTHALDRLPRDLFKPIAPATGKSPAPATLSVGTAAEGATIKEGSYLVHDGALVQIIDGKPQPVAIRHGKGTNGIPAKHARSIRGLISVRDAVREVLRAQVEDKPWGSGKIRLRSAYAISSATSDRSS